jgi:glycosyltransferase involved in cell wall biosynthesis
MVARRSKQKDYRTFFKALALVNVDCVSIVGDGTADNDFINEARMLAGLNFEKIEFLGVRFDVESILERSSVFVLSSHFEGLPISIIEAMSKGLPIIASSVGGVPEIVKHDINGFTFERGDFAQLAAFLNNLYYDVGKRARFGESSSRIFSELFMLNKNSHLVADFYGEILKKVDL